jgi:hypothetical protein
MARNPNESDFRAFKMATAAIFNFFTQKLWNAITQSVMGWSL